MDSYEIEKNNIIRDFFDIGSNPDIQVKVDAIKKQKEKLSKLLIKEEDSDVRNLINIIDSLLIGMLQEDKTKARKVVSYLWNMLHTQDNLSLFEIRLLICILPTASTPQELINCANICLKNLEIYQDHKSYYKIKIIIYNSLSYTLMLFKYNNNTMYKDKYDEILFESINELIELTIRHDDNEFSRAIIRKGVLLEDHLLIFAGLRLIDIDLDITEAESYGDFFVTYRNLL